jgi:hypothetical protein
VGRSLKGINFRGSGSVPLTDRKFPFLIKILSNASLVQYLTVPKSQQGELNANKLFDLNFFFESILGCHFIVHELNVFFIFNL